MKLSPRYLLIGALGTLLVGGGITTAVAASASSQPVHTARVTHSQQVKSAVDTPEPGDTPDGVDTPEPGDTPDVAKAAVAKAAVATAKGDAETADDAGKAATAKVDTPEPGDTPDAAGK